MTKATTPEEFMQEMQEIVDKEGDDRETAHADMDEAICRVLYELGYGGGVDIFTEQDKWYA